MTHQSGSEIYQLVLGLEIHLHLKTQTKMFCRCNADIYDSEPNTHTCPVCLGLPGALPVPNRDAIKKTQLLGLAMNCNLNTDSYFDRKHYFYPDLPKGYQISQYKKPLCENGYLDLDSGTRIELERIHLEEDTAKSFHQGDKTLIDFNKSGMPLVEIVTKPVFNSVEAAVEFCKKVQTLVRFLHIGDVDMEKGQMRLEANISMRTPEQQKTKELPKYKVEIKNINSFRFLERAVKAEMVRQTEMLEAGKTPMQENRGFNEATGKTVAQRAKEEAHDYRYFPEPDIPPMHFEGRYINNLKDSLPELPEQLVQRFVNQLNISREIAQKLVYTFGKELSDRFEKIVSQYGEPAKVANYLVNKKEYQGLNSSEFILKLKQEETKLTDTDELQEVVKKVIASNHKAVADYKSGNKASLEFLIGMIMRETKGKADPAIARDIVTSAIS